MGRGQSALRTGTPARWRRASSAATAPDGGGAPQWGCRHPRLQQLAGNPWNWQPSLTFLAFFDGTAEPVGWDRGPGLVPPGPGSELASAEITEDCRHLDRE